MDESSPGEANRFSSIQEIPDFLRKPQGHYHFHNSLPLFPILSHTNPVHARP